MAWSYQQGGGALSHDGELIANGYVGHGDGVNAPAVQDQPFVGPLPRGTYNIGPVLADGGHLGTFVLPLTPWPVNQMFGRAGFFIRGDTPARDRSASNGCIVLDRQWRQMIATSNDTLLIVT